MTTVYLDVYFFLNAVVNSLLLLCAARLDGSPRSRLRCLAGGGLGALYACLALFPGLAFLEHPCCKALSAAAMVLLAYGGRGRVLRTGGLFLLLSCAFGGGLLLLTMVGYGSPGWYPGLSVRSLLITAFLSYGILSLLLREEFTHTPSGGQVTALTLTRQGRSVTLPALRDSGNTLRDPLNGRPVVVVEGSRLTALLPGLPLDPGSLADPVSLLRSQEGSGLPLQLLPYRSVGVERGLLLALRMDSAVWGTCVCRNCLTALSPTPLSDGGSYCALVGEIQ